MNEHEREKIITVMEVFPPENYTIVNGSNVAKILGKF